MRSSSQRGVARGWIVGCVAVLVLCAAGLVVAVGYFGMKIADLEQAIEDDPFGTAEAWLSRNPAYEVLQRDPESRTLLLRDRDSGAHFRFEADRLGEGNPLIPVDPEEAVARTTPALSATPLPEWLPRPAASDPEPADGEAEARFSSELPLGRWLQTYRTDLERSGFEVIHASDLGGAGMLSARDAAGNSLDVTLGRAAGRTRILLQFRDGAAAAGD